MEQTSLKNRMEAEGRHRSELHNPRPKVLDPAPANTTQPGLNPLKPQLRPGLRPTPSKEQSLRFPLPSLSPVRNDQHVSYQGKQHAQHLEETA